MLSSVDGIHSCGTNQKAEAEESGAQAAQLLLTQPSITLHQSPFLHKELFCSFILITLRSNFLPTKFPSSFKAHLKRYFLDDIFDDSPSRIKNFLPSLQHNIHASVCCFIVFACEYHICLSLSSENSYSTLPSMGR